MTSRRVPLYKPLDRDRLAPLGARLELGAKGGRVHALSEAEVDVRTRFGAEDIVGLVLGKDLAEVRLGVVRPRMHLQGEVPAPHRVEPVEADGELGA